METEVVMHPAPWNLSGKGYILLYKFTEDFVNNRGNVPEFLQNTYAGGFGSVMLVDYTSSNAGPYSELLFIPGKFRHTGKHNNIRLLKTISRIYVSTTASVVNGRTNWAIPKEQANFVFSEKGKNTENIIIISNEQLVAEFTFKSLGPSFPVNTKLLPFPLVQHQDGDFYYRTFSGSGKGRIAMLQKSKVNPAMFPDISIVKPIAVIKVEPFNITFPVAVRE